MKRFFLIAVLFLALICPNWTMAQPPVPVMKPSLLVPKFIITSGSQISESTILSIRKSFVKELAFTGLYNVVDAANDVNCTEYYNEKQVTIEKNLELARKIGASYILFVQLYSKSPSNIKIMAQIQNLSVYDDYKRAEISTSVNSQDIADACKALVAKLCPNKSDVDYWVKVDQMPTFLGGDLFTFMNWVNERLLYPQAARDMGISGVVLVSFIIEKDGSLSDINILNSPDQSLTNEATRVLKLAPKWQPGKHYGDVVRVKYTMPIRFEKH